MVTTLIKIKQNLDDCSRFLSAYVPFDMYVFFIISRRILNICVDIHLMIKCTKYVGMYVHTYV